MGRDNSNAGQRILNARRTLTGADDSLENTIGRALQDGAQCFVIEAQASYRFLAQCTLPGDGEYIVVPQGDKAGRWVRETGLVGFALLEGGKLGENLHFGSFTYQKLVQFEMTPEALVYVGAMPRLAQLSAAVENMGIAIVLEQGTPRTVAIGIGTVSAAALLHPGERIRLRAEAVHDTTEPNSANLQVILT